MHVTVASACCHRLSCCQFAVTQVITAAAQGLLRLSSSTADPVLWGRCMQHCMGCGAVLGTGLGFHLIGCIWYLLELLCGMECSNTAHAALNSVPALACCCPDVCRSEGCIVWFDSARHVA